MRLLQQNLGQESTRKPFKSKFKKPVERKKENVQFVSNRNQCVSSKKKKQHERKNVVVETGIERPTTVQKKLLAKSTKMTR